MKKLNLFIYSAIISVLLFTGAQAQVQTQTIRGTITDVISLAPLPYSSIVLLNSDPLIGVVADIDGNFELKEVPVGNQSIRIQSLGFKERIIQNISVTSGKEVVLNITLEENAIQGKEVTIDGSKIEKNKPLNEFSTISARTFSVEETQKFAAAVNDPARMSTSFAGVVTTEDGNNHIAIRGNSPNGLLWRMEGVEIPNPNHFSAEGTSGGGISILSSQVLTNSDFLTGAFPAEYGNAISGVFDMKLRKGNNQKTERTIQVGLLGTDFAMEGPFSKNYNGSYLVNYRYSTLSMLDKLGVDIGDAKTTFQDISYNVFLPTNKAGNFSLFGFGGLSKQYAYAKKDSLKWENNFDRYSWNFQSNTGAAGFSHFMQLDKQSFLKTTIMLSGTEKSYSEEKFDNDYTVLPQGTQDHTQQKIAVTSVYTRKFNSRHSLKAGATETTWFYNLAMAEADDFTHIEETTIQQKGVAHTAQAFAEWNFKATNKLSINAGIHSQGFIENRSFSVEPRAAVKYALTPIQSISFGYGLHQQMQPIGVYFSRLQNADGSISQPNKDLGFTKAHHFVLGYDRSLTEYLHAKIETYYQHIYDVPVTTDTTETFSMLNNEYNFATDPLANNGAGRNYGVELTLEQYMHNNLYFLLSASLYDSKYRAANNQWYNTRFNGGFTLSFTAGKDVVWGKRTVGFNVKTIYAGGLRHTPIDIEQSVLHGNTQYVESRPFEIQASNYFRTDVKFSVKRNRAKSATSWSLDIQNVSNQKNLSGEYFDPSTGKTKSYYQAPLIPVLSYRVDF